MKHETRSMVLYEAPHRLVRTLEALFQALGNRRISVCRELTKKHETVFSSLIEEAVLYYKAHEPKGECVIIIEGRSRQEVCAREREEWEEMSIGDHMEFYLGEGMEKKEAMKKVAKDRGVSKREIYQALLPK